MAPPFVDDIEVEEESSSSASTAGSPSGTGRSLARHPLHVSAELTCEPV